MKYVYDNDKQMSINLRDIKRGFFVPFLHGMRSSTTIITNFFLIGSKIRTLYKPRGLYSLVTNIRRIESGNSLAQANAATSQQSPKDAKIESESDSLLSPLHIYLVVPHRPCHPIDIWHPTHQGERMYAHTTTFLPCHSSLLFVIVICLFVIAARHCNSSCCLKLLLLLLDGFQLVRHSCSIVCASSSHTDCCRTTPQCPYQRVAT